MKANSRTVVAANVRRRIAFPRVRNRLLTSAATEYRLHHKPNLPLAIIEAKDNNHIRPSAHLSSFDGTSAIRQVVGWPRWKRCCCTALNPNKANP